MWSDYETLILNGEKLNGKQLSKKANDVIQQANVELWKKKVYIFILEWLNTEDSVIVHTSGSTGKPKPIHILKEQMVNSALATGIFFNLKRNDKALLCLPCDYIAGKMMVVRAFVLKMNLILAPSDNPLEDKKMQIDFAAMVPLQVEKILNKDSGNINRIKQLIIGGAAVNQELLKRLQSIQTNCFATYGMTETVTHIAVKKLNGQEASDFYETLPHVHLSKDERACLVINAPKVTAEIIITNDIIALESDNKFKLLGRFDNVINSGGVKLFPEQIEGKLNGIIAPRFFISSLPHPILGEQVVLILEQKPMDFISLEAFRIGISQLLDKYEKPKQIFFVPKFKETETGKLKRQSILEQIKKHYNLS